MRENIRFYVVEYADGELTVQSNPDGGGYMLDLPRSMNRSEAILFTLAANAVLDVLGMLKYD
jgi:hypothetical protein